MILSENLHPTTKEIFKLVTVDNFRLQQITKSILKVINGKMTLDEERVASTHTNNVPLAFRAK